MGKTIIDLGNSEATITDPSQYYIETQKNGESVTKRTLLTKVITYLQTLFAPKFNAANTATGASSVTINARSGVATFTDAVLAGDNPKDFIVLNSLITTNSKVIYSLYYEPNDTEVLHVLSYQCVNGQLLFRVFCLNGYGGANQNITISFQILN